MSLELWESLERLGLQNPYNPPFFWQKFYIQERETGLLLNEVGNLYLELIWSFVGLYRSTNDLGKLIRSKSVGHEDNIKVMSRAWNTIEIIHRLFRFLNLKNNAASFLKALGNFDGDFLNLEELSRSYRNIDAHRSEKFSNSVGSLKSPLSRGVLIFAYVRHDEDLRAEGRSVIPFFLIPADTIQGREQVIASLEGYPRNQSTIRRGASCISLFYERKRFDLSDDVYRMIQALSDMFSNMESQMSKDKLKSYVDGKPTGFHYLSYEELRLQVEHNLTLDPEQ